MELFTRNPDLLDLAEESSLTPIPTDEDFKSSPPDVKSIDKTIGLQNLETDSIIRQIEQTFLF